MKILLLCLMMFTCLFAFCETKKAEENKDNAKEELEELKISYPEFKMISLGGYPHGILNLEKGRQKNTLPPKFFLPKGCSNIALKKTVSASDEDPVVGDLEFITDGDADAEEFVTFRRGLQWVQIDLEKAHRLYAAQLWQYHLSPRVYYDIVIQISDDEDFVEGVVTVFNNDHDNSSGLGKGTDKNYIGEHYGRTIDLKGTKGRYVRFYSNGNTDNRSNDYIEIQIFGKH